MSVRLACVISASAIVATGSEARADEGARFGAEARSGVGLPLGKVDGGAGDLLSGTARAQIPIWLSVGVRTPRVYVGIQLGYGIGFLGDALQSDCAGYQTNDYQSSLRCTVRERRLGLEAQYHLRPDATWDPWVGVGLGFEWLAIGRTDSSDTVEAFGWETRLDAGLDARLGALLRAGPFVALNPGEYLDVASTGAACTTVRCDSPIDHGAFHAWLFAGVRVVIDPAPGRYH